MATSRLSCPPQCLHSRLCPARLFLHIVICCQPSPVQVSTFTHSSFFKTDLHSLHTSKGGFQCLTSICHPSAQSKVRDGGQNQISSQGVLAEYQPRPMHSPPPLRRASLPLFQTNYNPANPTPPLHNAPAHTPPLFLDALEGGSSLHHRDSLLSLQTDTRSAPLPASSDTNIRR